MNTLHAAFEKLGARPGTTFDILKQRYKVLVMVWHPDRMTTDEGRKVAEEELKNINNAFDCIKKHFQSGHRQGPNCECQYEAIGSNGNPQTGGQAGSNTNTSGDTASGKSQAQQEYEERLRKEAEARKQAEENLRKEQAARAQEAERRRQAEEAQQTAIKEALERARQDTAAKSVAATAAKVKSFDDAVLREKVAAAFAVIFVILLAVGSIHKDPPSQPTSEWTKVEHLRPNPFLN